MVVLSGNMQSLAPRLAKLNELIGDVPGLMAPTPPKLLAPVSLPGQIGPGMPDPAAAAAAAAFTPGKLGNAFQPGATSASLLVPGKLGGAFFPAVGQPASADAQPATPQAPAGTPSGVVGDVGGQFAPLDQFDQAFAAAGAKYGLDPNLLKSVAMEEGGWPGTHDATGSAAGAYGIMQVMPDYWDNEAHQLGFGDYQTNPTSNIMMGAYILKSMIDQWGGTQSGVQHYLGEGVDPATGISTNQYWNSVNDYWSQLGHSQKVAGTAFLPGGGMAPATGTSSSGGFSSIWGGWDAPITQGFGAYGGPDLYGYGIGHGLDGKQHTGIDVGVPRGTTLYAPISGTVVCSGTGNGPGAHGSGCAAFNDADGGGAGRVEIVSDDGRTSIILGHASAALLAPGTHVGVGQAVAKSGGEYGDHVHVEARVWSNGDYTIVDPTSVLGAATGAFAGAGSGAMHAPAISSGPGLIGGMTPGDRMRQLLNGGGQG